MSERSISFKAHLVESFWETNDAVLVKTIRGKIWFCKKTTKEEFQKQVENFRANKPIEFVLKAKMEVRYD